jgi:hypothetical protein
MDPDELPALPFLDHIADLRKMLIKMLVVLGLMMGGAFAFQKTVVEIIERPLVAIDPDRTSLTNFGVASEGAKLFPKLVKRLSCRHAMGGRGFHLSDESEIRGLVACW